MQIAIIGTGAMGRSLGRQFARHGHQVFWGSREPGRGQALARTVGGTAQGGGVADAVQASEIVLLAVPYPAVADTLGAAGSLAGKILIDITNPLTPDYMDVSIGHTTSAAEEIARLVPEARVVKAFNTIGWQQVHAPPASPRWSVFYAGDDSAATAVVAGLIQDIGLEPIDVGPLTSARYLEPAVVVSIRYRFGPQGPGANFDIGLGLVLRQAEALPKA